MYKNNMYYNITSTAKKVDVLMTSSDCPFNCYFCQNLTGHKFLTHSPERVVEELDNMVSRGIKAVEIMDDTFTFKRSRVEKIFDLIERRNYDLEFRIRSRVNLIDEDLLRRFKRIGGRAISYGMESGSDKILKSMNKGTTVKQNEEACRLTRKQVLFVIRLGFLAGQVKH